MSEVESSDTIDNAKAKIQEIFTTLLGLQELTLHRIGGQAFQFDTTLDFLFVEHTVILTVPTLYFDPPPCPQFRWKSNLQ
jgi:hypothetical protein